MLHIGLIAVHATAALVCFASGFWIVYRPDQMLNRIQIFPIYFGALVIMMVFLFAAILTDWSQLEMIKQIAFAVLGVLGLYMLLRGFQARQALQNKAQGWQRRFIDDIGFTLISLFDGFIIVSAIDLKFPGWLIIIGAVLAILAGIVIVNSFKRQATAE